MLNGEKSDRELEREIKKKITKETLFVGKTTSKF